MFWVYTHSICSFLSSSLRRELGVEIRVVQDTSYCSSDVKWADVVLSAGGKVAVLDYAIIPNVLYHQCYASDCNVIASFQQRCTQLVTLCQLQVLQMWPHVHFICHLFLSNLCCTHQICTALFFYYYYYFLILYILFVICSCQTYVVLTK